MSRKGNCWDNAVAENFFKILKSELIYHIPQLQLDQARIEIFEFIEIWRPPLRYNRKRKHSYLNYLTPEQFQKLNQSIAA
jgi:putative transposase